MSQSKFVSFCEASLNTIVGYVLSLCVQVLVFLWYGIELQLYQNMEIVCVFAVVSLARSYVLRRIFNK